MKQVSATYAATEFKEFFTNVIAAQNMGRSQLYIMESTRNQKYLKLIRCDDKTDLKKDRVVNGKSYPAWDNVIPAVAEKKEELYFSMNSFYGERRTERLHSLQNCWVDIDNHSGKISYKTAKTFCERLIWRLQHDELPIPYCVFSGRGIHLFWPIIPCGKKELQTWGAIQYALADYVETIIADLDFMVGWEVDKKVQDVARIMRVPGTYNKSARAWTRFIPSPYTPPCDISDFAEALQLFDADKAYSRQSLETPALQMSQDAITDCDKYAAEQRYWALIEFAKSRQMNLEGVRNTYTTILASTLMVLDPHTAKQKTISFCKQLTPAQSTSEIVATVNCCSRNPYKWKNETISSRLGMDKNESERFVASNKVRAYSSASQKNRVRNKTRDEARTLRKREKESRYKQIPVLYAKGYSYAEIARCLEISLSTVKRHARRLINQSQEKTVKRFRMKKIRETVARIRANRSLCCRFVESPLHEAYKRFPKNVFRKTSYRIHENRKRLARVFGKEIEQGLFERTAVFWCQKGA